MSHNKIDTQNPITVNSILPTILMNCIKTDSDTRILHNYNFLLIEIHFLTLFYESTLEIMSKIKALFNLKDVELKNTKLNYI